MGDCTTDEHRHIDDLQFTHHVLTMSPESSSLTAGQRMGSGHELSSFVFDTENRAESIRGDFFRGTAFHTVYQPLVSVTAHDDQVACFLFSGIDDF